MLSITVEREEKQKKLGVGSTEILTLIAEFRVLSANHYTIEPYHSELSYFIRVSLSDPKKGRHH